MTGQGSHATRGMSLADKLAFHSIPEPNSGCLLWLAGVDRRGYGKIGFGGKHLKAHRVAWCIAKGDITDGLEVCHRCDNPGCINPAHLFLGTTQENTADRARKGRSAAGERHGCNRISAQTAIAIYCSPLPQRQIAEAYGVSKSLVAAIKVKKLWASIHGSPA